MLKIAAFDSESNSGSEPVFSDSDSQYLTFPNRNYFKNYFVFEKRLQFFVGNFQSFYTPGGAWCVRSLNQAHREPSK